VSTVTVAIPVRNGGDLLVGTLRSLAGQSVAHELLVCDSGSRDDSVAVARAHGARVIEIGPYEFGHGSTRNLLMREAAGEHVALLTQDAEPGDERWLERLLEGFSLADDVAIAYGPYRPRDDASLAVRIELERWFESLSPDGTTLLERLDPEERRSLRVVELVGRRGFVSDANACIARAAWKRIPFRDVPYAEDRMLAIDMLRAGYAKAFVPRAAVIHSHAYTSSQQLRRSFDEWRALLEIYGWREPASPRHVLSRIRGMLGQANGELAARHVAWPVRASVLAGVAGHQLSSLCGALLGSRADVMPASVRRVLSLDRRASFAPLRLDAAPATTGAVSGAHADGRPR